MRGNLAKNQSFHTNLSLSPRMRGNRNNLAIVTGWSKSIPAYAGEP